MSKPISLSVTENNNGVKTFHVLFDDGNILSRLEGHNDWTTEQPCISRCRDNDGSPKDTSSGNKRKRNN